jgi:hypothetical protein
LAKIESITALELNNAKITGESFAYLSRLLNLRKLSTRGGNSINDDSVAHLTALSKLEDFACHSGDFSDRTFELLSQIPSLRKLQVGGENFTDYGLAKLAEFRRSQHRRQIDH